MRMRGGTLAALLIVLALAVEHHVGWAARPGGVVPGCLIVKPIRSASTVSARSLVTVAGTAAIPDMGSSCGRCRRARLGSVIARTPAP
jgi:hypothetical protein